MNKKIPILSPLVNILLYDALLVATPFLMVTNYLQSSLREFSHLSLTIFDHDLPFVVMAAVVALGLFLAFNVKKFSKIRVIACFGVVVLFGLGQLVTDFYLNMSFFDIQQNWHYFAYSGFVFVMYRYYRQNKTGLNKFIVITYFKALILSCFDEGFQYFLSNRIFDVGDIAKDSWGAIIGLFIVLFIVFEKDYVKNFKDIRHRKLKSYLKDANFLFVFLLIFAFLLMSISSLLTDFDYVFPSVVIPVICALIVFVVIHLTQFKAAKISLIGVLGLAVILFGTFYFSNKDSGVYKMSEGIVVCNGIPVPYFDVMVYPDGTFRLVDKKETFNGGDLRTITAQDGDILLIGSGESMHPVGFGSSRFVQYLQFMYSPGKYEGMQTVALPIESACQEYNRLVEEGKKVLFIIHNS